MSVLLERRPVLGREEQQVLAHCIKADVPYRYVELGRVRNGQASPAPGELPVGTVEFVDACLRSLGKRPPRLPTYPKCVRAYPDVLGRRVWDTTVKRLAHEFDSGLRQEPVFVKPATEAKRFTGLVVSSSSELLGTGARRSLAVSCSEVVDFVSEFRYYVNTAQAGRQGWCACLRRYSGLDEDRMVDGWAINRAFDAVEAHGFAPVAYALDFGRLRDGRTVLVEFNDGYALGNYGWEVEPYLAFLRARWEQMLDAAPATA